MADRMVPRSTRERRAYRLAVVGGGLGAAGVIALVLAVFGVVGFFDALLLLVLAAVCGLLFRRTVS